MNALVLRRERAFYRMDPLRSGMTRFLGADLMKERWMGIYHRHKKVGYTGATFEKIFAEEGIEVHCRIESEMGVLAPLAAARLEGSMVLDAELRPLRLNLEARLGDLGNVRLTGERRALEFEIVLWQGSTRLLSKSLPLEELILGDVLAPIIPMAGFEVGETYRVPCLDPLSMTRVVTEVQVKSKSTESVEGQMGDVFTLETTFRGLTSKSMVTASGELLRQEFGPPLADLVLRKESKRQAKSWRTP
jgi:hypothetical protein